jgi:hypothetical protein
MARLVRLSSGATATLSGVVAVVAAAGCASREPNTAAAHPAQSPTVGAPADARAELARLVAAFKDRYFTAGYTWTRYDGAGTDPTRTVTVTLAADDTWRVDVPAADVSLVGRPEAVYQCGGRGCVRIAKTAQSVPAQYDIKVHHPFTDWPSSLIDRDAALAVTRAATLPGVTGACFSVEPTTVAVAPPIDPGVFCYDDTGLPTAVRTRFGTLALAGSAAAAPPTASLTGPIGSGPPLPVGPPADASSAPAGPSRRG